MRLSGHFSIFALVFFLLVIARQRSREKFAILSLKPRNSVRILIYQTWVVTITITITITIGITITITFAVTITIMITNTVTITIAITNTITLLKKSAFYLLQFSPCLRRKLHLNRSCRATIWIGFKHNPFEADFEAFIAWDPHTRAKRKSRSKQKRLDIR